MIRAVSGQPIGANIRDASTGAPFVGTVTVYIKGDLTPQAQGTVGGGIAASDGHGYFEYVPSAGETDFNHIAFTFDGTGAVGATIQVETITPAQVSALQTATGLGSVIVSDLVTSAYAEIRVARPGDTLEPALMDFGVDKLNRLIDRYNANPRATYVVGFQSFVPIPNHAPHTIGPNSADWLQTGRPTFIRGANIILNTVSPAIRIPIQIRDREWWLNQSVQGLATAFVTDLYYEPGWPNGTVNLWPMPTTAYPIELELDGTLNALVATDVFWLPYGYRDAITLRLGCELASSNGQTPSQYLVDSARDAEATIFLQNDQIANLVTRDGGMPGGGRSGRFNYLTGRLMN